MLQKDHTLASGWRLVGGGQAAHRSLLQWGSDLARRTVGQRIGLQRQDVRETGRKTPHREAVSEVQRQTDMEEAKMIPNFGAGPGWVVWPFRR